jgi:hypothetical protein
MSDKTANRGSDQWSSSLAAFVNALDLFPWFEKVGAPIEAEHVMQVFSWDAAWEHTQDESWTNASFHKDVDQSHPAWAEAYDKALQAISKSGRDHELQEGVSASLQGAWDAGGAAYQIATGNHNGFYLKLMDWYRRGHWRCGWDGTYPQGRLIVF